MVVEQSSRIRAECMCCRAIEWGKGRAGVLVFGPRVELGPYWKEGGVKGEEYFLLV